MQRLITNEREAAERKVDVGKVGHEAQHCHQDLAEYDLHILRELEPFDRRTVHEIRRLTLVDR